MLNSVYEGLPHVVLEAMALGLPVVATAVGGTPEVVKDREIGVLVNPDGADLVSVLRGLFENKAEWIRMGRKAKQWVSSRFNGLVMLDETEEVLKALDNMSR
jgi:glycosyltransferase involved in cell wall biosynthesis